MEELKYTDPDNKWADENGVVHKVMALVDGSVTWIPKQHEYCYRHEIAALEAIFNRVPHVISDPKNAIESSSQVFDFNSHHIKSELRLDRNTYMPITLDDSNFTRDSIIRALGIPSDFIFPTRD